MVSSLFIAAASLHGRLGGKDGEARQEGEGGWNEWSRPDIPLVFLSFSLIFDGRLTFIYTFLFVCLQNSVCVCVCGCGVYFKPT